MLLSIASSGCMGLAMQRELMEGMRDDPREEIVPVEPIVQAHIFAQNECIFQELRATNQETDCYSNESVILVDETVSKMLLDFSVSFEWSSTVGEFLGNNTDELRFVEITLLKPNGDKCWEYLATSSVGQMSLELRSESDCTISIGNSSGFTNGNWVLQCQGQRICIYPRPSTHSRLKTSSESHFGLQKKCIVFPEIHAEGECTFSSELE